MSISLNNIESRVTALEKSGNGSIVNIHEYKGNPVSSIDLNQYLTSVVNHYILCVTDCESKTGVVSYATVINRKNLDTNYHIGGYWGVSTTNTYYIHNNTFIASNGARFSKWFLITLNL